MQLFRLTVISTLGFLFIANLGQLAHGAPWGSSGDLTASPHQALHRRSPLPALQKVSQKVSAAKNIVTNGAKKGGAAVVNGAKKSGAAVVNGAKKGGAAAVNGAKAAGRTIKNAGNKAASNYHAFDAKVDRWAAKRSPLVHPL